MMLPHLAARVPLFLDQALQVAPVFARGKRLGKARDLVEINESLAIGDLLRAGELDALPALDGLDEGRCRDEGLMRARVEPRNAAPERFDLERPTRQISAVDVGDLELAARRGLERGRDLDDVRIVEIKPCHRISRLWLRWFFLDRHRASLRVEGDDAEVLGIAHMISENGRAAIARGGALEVGP